MSKLIVISNRMAMPGTSQAGGMAVALAEALKKKGGIWCGWSGEVRECPKIKSHTQDNIQYIALDLTQQDYDSYYLGFSNSVLWPLFHYRIGLTHYTPEMYEAYRRVNRSFAQAVALQIAPEDTIWVQDYHLLELGAQLRELKVKSRLGFFLHIPFPVPEVLTALPVYKEMLRAMCAYDLLGFQTPCDMQSFVRCVEELCGGSVIRRLDSGIVEMQVCNDRFKVGCFPIGIDTHAMERTAQSAMHEKPNVQLRRSLNGRDMLIGVDRMDYTKGLPLRLEAFGHFLHTHPEVSGKVSYIQITPSSRTEVEEYRELCEEVERMAAHINGAHATIDWVPIRYLNKSFTRDQLAGFYRSARVGLVTPLRDGMNLVAKEYVASQDPSDPGVLVLSCFAGAAREMPEALIVNPYDTFAMAKTIGCALHMPLQERKERHAALMHTLRRNTVFHWCEAFLTQLAKAERPSDICLPLLSPVPYSQSMQPIPATFEQAAVL